MMIWGMCCLSWQRTTFLMALIFIKQIIFNTNPTSSTVPLPGKFSRQVGCFRELFRALPVCVCVCVAPSFGARKTVSNLITITVNLLLQHKFLLLAVRAKGNPAAGSGWCSWVGSPKKLSFHFGFSFTAGEASVAAAAFNKREKKKYTFSGVGDGGTFFCKEMCIIGGEACSNFSAFVVSNCWWWKLFEGRRKWWELCCLFRIGLLKNSSKNKKYYCLNHQKPNC